MRLRRLDTHYFLEGKWRILLIDTGTVAYFLLRVVQTGRWFLLAVSR